MKEINYDYLQMSMTRAEFEQTDFCSMTFEKLYHFNNAHPNEFEQKYRLRYKVTITDEEGALVWDGEKETHKPKVEEFLVSIDKLVYNELRNKRLKKQYGC